MYAIDEPFDQAPFGAIGLETSLGVMLSHTGWSVAETLAAMSWVPRMMLTGEGSDLVVGSVADIAVIDPEAEWTVDAAASASRSRNTPFDGETLTGRCRHTVVGGEPVVVNHEIQP